MKIPSLELFQALQQEMNRRRNVFEGLGFIDTRCVFAVEADNTTPESHYYAVEFAVYSCERVWEVPYPEAADPDFIIFGQAKVWKEMFENIAENGGADVYHSINRLTMAYDPMQMMGNDIVRRESFWKYNQSLQEFLNGYAYIAGTRIEV